MAFPGDPERYPTRDEVVAYLRQYAAHFQLPVMTGARVVSVTRAAALFTVNTADGRQFQACTLIAATGSFHSPYLPKLPGQEQFRGTMLHSFAYQDLAPFAGRRVVVVGAGNSAVQIVVELARVARVTLATRAPVRYVPHGLFGCDNYVLHLSAIPHRAASPITERMRSLPQSGPFSKSSPCCAIVLVTCAKQMIR